MGVKSRVVVRFGEPRDLEWCVAEDPLANEMLMREKIMKDEIFIAELDGEPIGYLRLEFLWARVPYIGLVFIIEAYQHEGIARMLLDRLESHLKENGYDLLLSSSQVDEPEPQAWHRAVGFEECGILLGVNESGVGEVFFRKSLWSTS
ncbi:MAG: GNAT family N-acetyltransferase [Candidatus Thorarchaeota archaeon]